MYEGIHVLYCDDGTHGAHVHDGTAENDTGNAPGWYYASTTVAGEFTTGLMGPFKNRIMALAAAVVELSS